MSDQFETFERDQTNSPVELFSEGEFSGIRTALDKLNTEIIWICLKN